MFNLKFLSLTTLPYPGIVYDYCYGSPKCSFIISKFVEIYIYGYKQLNTSSKNMSKLIIKVVK